MSHYQVKWTVSGVTQYGIASTATYNSKGARIEAKPGKVFVEEAITGFTEQIDESLLVDIEMGFPKWDETTGDLIEGDEFEMYVDAERKKAEKTSEECGRQLKPGKMFFTPVGDGTAYYVVTKVGPKTCTVEWRGFSGDRWVDHFFGHGGNFRNSDIKRYL